MCPSVSLPPSFSPSCSLALSFSAVRRAAPHLVPLDVGAPLCALEMFVTRLEMCVLVLGI